MRNRLFVVSLATATACITGYGIWQGRIYGMTENFLDNERNKAEIKNFNGAIADYKTALQVNPNYERASEAIGYIDQRVSSASTRKIQRSSLQKYINRRQVRTGQGRSALSGLETALRLSAKPRRAETYQQPQRQTRRLAPQLPPPPVDYRFPFPMDACGDQPDATVEAWYPVYVDFSQQLLTHIKSNYCRDAIQTVVNGRKLIQVASFADRYKAQEFADILRARVGSGKVGNPTVVKSTDFPFPMDACGDQPVSPKDRWYPVYVDYSEPLFAHIKSSYCRDAVTVNVYGRRVILVASFRTPDTAQQFADFLRERVGSGMVGEPVVP
jgi:hypothetical protein